MTSNSYNRDFPAAAAATTATDIGHTPITRQRDGQPHASDRAALVIDDGPDTFTSGNDGQLVTRAEELIASADSIEILSRVRLASHWRLQARVQRQGGPPRNILIDVKPANATTIGKENEPELAPDLLIGAAAIAEFLFGVDGDRKKKRRKVFHLAKTSRLPIIRNGTLWARRSTLRAWMAEQERRNVGATEPLSANRA